LLLAAAVFQNICLTACCAALSQSDLHFIPTDAVGSVAV